MKEMQPVRLTTEAVSPKLGVGRKIMSDGPNSEAPKPEQAPAPKKPEITPQSTVVDATPEASLEQRWQTFFEKNNTPIELRGGILENMVSRGQNPPDYLLPEERGTEVEEKAREAHPELVDREFVPVKSMLAPPPPLPTAPGLPSADSAENIALGINPNIFAVPEFFRIADALRSDAALGALTTRRIDTALGNARRQYETKGSDRNEYLALVQFLNEAKSAAGLREHVIQTNDLVQIAENYPDLKARIPRINKLIQETANSKKIDTAEYEALVSEINALTLPVAATDPEKLNFSYAKAAITGSISERLSEITGGSERETITKQVEKLVRAMEQAGATGTPGDYDAIEQIIQGDGMDTSSPIYSTIIDRAVTELRGQSLEHIREYVLTYALERIISQGDANTEGSYPQFTLYETENISRITQTARRFDEEMARSHIARPKEMFKYLVDLKEKRMAMHELFRSIKNNEKYTGLVTEYLRQSGLAFVEKQVEGVKELQRIFEQLFGSELSLTTNGWLLKTDVFRIFNQGRNTLAADAASGRLKTTYTKTDGTVVERPLRPWEVDRGYFMGRSLYAVSQRANAYIAFGDIPWNFAHQYQSVFGEYIHRTLAIVKTAPRFFGQPISRRFMKKLFHELRRNPNDDKEDPYKYGYIGSDGKEHGYYGRTQEAIAYTDTGIFDLKSNSWRTFLMLLDQGDYKTISMGGKDVSIGEVLETLAQPFVVVDPKHETAHMSHHNKTEYNKLVAPLIEQQRLFLGTLMRYGNLDDHNKEVIWKNVAKLLPSRIAALMPEELFSDGVMGTGTKEQKMERWLGPDPENHPEQGLRYKLWVAERLRVDWDAKVLKVGGGGFAAVRTLESFFTEAGITDPSDVEIIQKIQKLGHDNVKYLAKARFNYTAFMDDAPKTDWENLGEEDYDRLMIGDAKQFAEGYGALLGLAANPMQSREDIIEALHTGVEKIGGPLGFSAGQKRVEPFWQVLLQMRRLSRSGEWAGLLKDLARRPKSEIGEFNIQSKFGEDAENEKALIDAMADKEIISDNPNEEDLTDTKGEKKIGEKIVKHGRTQYQRALDRGRADRKHQWERIARLIIQLFGPAFAKAFFGITLENMKDLKV